MDNQTEENVIKVSDERAEMLSKRFGGRVDFSDVPDTGIPDDQNYQVEEQPAATTDEPKNTETPKAETKAESVETSSLKTEAPASEEKPAVVDLSSLTNGKFKSVEEILSLEQKARELEEKLNSTTIDPFIAKLDELKKSGKNITPELLNEMSIDYSAMDVSNKETALALIMKKMKQDEPTLTDREIQLELKSRFGSLTEPDEYAEDDVKEAYEIALSRLRREASKVKPQLEQFQKELLEPLRAQEQKTNEQIQAEKAQQEAWRNQVSQEVSKLKRLPFTVDGEEFGFDIQQEDNSFVEKSIQNLNTFFSDNFLKPDGSIDFEGLSEAIYFSKKENRQKVTNALLAQTKAKATKEVVSTLNNTNLKPSTSTAQVEKAKLPPALQRAWDMEAKKRGW